MDEYYIFTFGYDHVHPLTGERLNNNYVKIHLPYEEARALMLERFGNRWAFQYKNEAEAGVYNHNLTELEDFQQ